jgi:hypothetical protein
MSARWFALSLLAIGCGTSSGQAPEASGDAAPACAPSDALWVASDYSSSGVGALALAGAVTSTVGRVDLGGDPALAVSRGRAFYVARDEDLIFELDPICGTPETRFDVHVAAHTGSSDPYDVGVAQDGSLWVPLFEVPAVLVLGPDGSVSRTIDLSSYDSDGNPDAMGIAIVDTPAGEKAFVPLDRLSGPALMSEQPSWMLRIDVASGEVETTIPLEGRNPFSMITDGSVLWLAEPGNFDDATEPLAGVERFDTSTSTTALVAHETDLGGSVSEVAVSAGCGVAIVADATAVNATSLVTFDVQSGAAIAPASQSPLPTAGFDLEGLDLVAGAFAVGDRRRASSGYPVHVFDASPACDLTERADKVFLPLPSVTVRVVQ